MKGKDITSHSRNETDRSPRVISVMSDIGKFGYTVHRHIDYPGEWLLSSSSLDFEKERLGHISLEEALAKAKSRISEILSKRISQYEEIKKELEDFNNDYK